MEKIDYLLVGGGLASAKCAAKLRELGATGRVMIVGDEAQLPYNRPPLSKGLLLGYETAEQIAVFDQGFYSTRQIELTMGVKAVRADAAKKTVALSDGRQLSYSALLVATGTSARRLSAPGAELDGVHYLRNLDDALAIKGAAKQGTAGVIVGAGFIGMELAAAFAENGVDTTMLVRDSGLFTRLGSEALTKFFGDFYTQHGLKIIFNDEVDHFSGDGALNSLTTKNGQEIRADLAAVGIGVTANIEWLEGSGVEVDRGVVVDEQLRSAADGVFAAGDVAVYYDPIFQKQRRVEHWDNAIKQGELVAANMLGGTLAVDYVAYFYSDLFDISWEWLGDSSDADETVVREAADGRPELVFYLNQGRLRAAFLMLQGPDERAWVEKMIRAGSDLTALKTELASTSIPLKSIANL